MPLISLAEGLAHAREHHYSLGAFNVLDSHFLRALFAAARQERSPFIINIAEVHQQLPQLLLSGFVSIQSPAPKSQELCKR